MNKLPSPRRGFVILTLCAACQAIAQSVDIKWGSDERFARTVQVSPSQPYEFCKSLAPGQKLQWSFESSQTLSYTVYAVNGKDKAALGRTESGWRTSGKVGPATGVDRYCWSWTNSSAKPVELAFDIRLDR